MATHNQNGYTKTGLLLVPVLVAAIVFVGSDRTPPSQARDTNPQSLVAGVLDAEYVAPKAETTAITGSEQPKNSGTVINGSRQCGYSLSENLAKKKPYLLKQIVQLVEVPDSDFGLYEKIRCLTRDDERVLVTAGEVEKSCPAYAKPSPRCPSAVIHKDATAKTTEIICGNESKTDCGVTTKQAADVLEKVSKGEQPTSSDFSLVEEYLKGGESARKSLDSELAQRQIVSPDTTETIFAAQDGGLSSDDVKVVKAGYTPKAGNDVKSAPQKGVQTQTDTLDIKSASTPKSQTNAGANQYGATTQSTPSPQTPVASNPVTRASRADAVQRSGAGVAANANSVPTNNSYQPQTNPYQSLQWPDIFQPTQNSVPSAITGNSQPTRQPSLLNKLARFVGSQGLFNRQTPRGNTTIQTAQQPTPVVIVGKPVDAHIRNIQEIAYDVAKQQTQPTDTRIESFEKTLTVVGGVHTSGRATTTINSEYGRILDLITEDQAIKALEVAEKTGLRVRNRVFCIKDEKSEDCLLRRNTAAKRVERQTFVTELEKSNGISQADLEHFLAVYDGWVSPEAPRPKAQPISLIDAPEKTTAADANDTATTTPGFISRVTTGIGKGVQKILNALTSWLTP